jgi:hypothetical protein
MKLEDLYMSQKDELLGLLTEARASRRNILKQAAQGTAMLAAGSLLAGCGGAAGSALSTATNSAIAKQTIAPADVLNFALNLEYLEAEYYTYATTGSGIDAGVTGDVFPTNAQVPFQNYGAIAAGIAKDEQNHVAFLQTALGTAAVARPPIDLVNSFNAAANAAGIGSSFNPFSSELNFILGAFIFEDVGVTAYHGGAGYLTSNLTYLSAAAGILGTEAYHAGAIRRIIASYGGMAVTIANQISALRAKASESVTPSTPDETSTPFIVAADTNAIAFARTPQQVLDIVYLNASATPASSGGFFPSGLNGNITSSAS